MNENVKVIMNKDDFQGGLRIGIFVRQGDGGWANASVVNGELIFDKVEPGQCVKPMLVIPWNFVDDFLKAAAQELEDRGIKTDSAAKIEGTLEATRLHLEDMRKLVFEPRSLPPTTLIPMAGVTTTTQK